MGARIESLPISPIQAGKKWGWLVAGTLALCLAAGSAAYFALQHDEPAASSSAAHVSGALAGRGRALAQQAASLRAASFPSVAALERQVTAYGPSAAPLGLAELRGVDVVGIGTAGFWSKAGAITSAGFPSVAALERQVGQVAISSAGFPSVAALERQFGQVAITSPTFPSVAALERQVSAYGISSYSGIGPRLAELRGVDILGFGTAGLWATEGASNPPAANGCMLIRHGPC